MGRDPNIGQCRICGGPPSRYMEAGTLHARAVEIIDVGRYAEQGNLPGGLRLLLYGRGFITHVEPAGNVPSET